MPTVLVIFGWRLFFYSNEGSEPVHIHAEKGDMECKFWLLVNEVEIREAFAYNMTPAETREIKKISHDLNSHNTRSFLRQELYEFKN